MFKTQRVNGQRLGLLTASAIFSMVVPVVPGNTADDFVPDDGIDKR